MSDFARAIADLADRINLIITAYFILLGVTVVLVIVAINKINGLSDKMQALIRDSNELRHEISLLKQQKRNEAVPTRTY